MSEKTQITIDGIEYVRKDAIQPEIVSQECGAWIIGQDYHIRTVTMALHGKLVAVTPQELVLQDAAWIADSGRFADYMAGKEPSEIEPFPEGNLIVGRGSVIDAFVRAGSFRNQK